MIITEVFFLQKFPCKMFAGDLNTPLYLQQIEIKLFTRDISSGTVKGFLPHLFFIGDYS